ncbi:ATPase morc2 [Cichlidogyrus casuarinus]|uniref:ATPase morc2 n=1 Tax=Cichlidogyrus casuarinus TaxID=1844966 RepID=A0ABD2Q220_9PLAT
MEDYSGLNRAQLSYDYLHTNSTTHEFLFGAIAELIDNSRDAHATELEISTVQDATLRGGFMLCVGDNGEGMSPEDARNVVIFGKSVKKNSEGSSIGMYGNGLKSGSMRIGNDMIIFTKKDNICTCLLLSRTFHELEKLDEIIVPLPSFKANDDTPNVSSDEERRRHEMEMQIIFRYSPFKTIRSINSQFAKLKQSSGTMIIIYNMKLLDNGLPELDILSDPQDIILSGYEEKAVDIDADVELPEEKRSLRAYVALLYYNPHMKVYLQGRKVQTKRLMSNLYNVRCYTYASNTFKTRAERDLNTAKSGLRVAEHRAKECDSKAKDFELRIGTSPDPDQLKQLRKLQMLASEAHLIVEERLHIVDRKKQALKEPKTITFYFGLNVLNRAQDGMFVYNCSRLIKMYQRIGPQNDSTSVCRGVVGIVDVPYLVLEPTHNKQDFADAKEYRFLTRTMADHLMQYWDDIEIENSHSTGSPDESISRFWKGFGYMSARWRDPPSREDKFIRKRFCCIKPQVQCDKCLKWRTLPFNQSNLKLDVADKWQCRDNVDPKHKSCNDPEEDTAPPRGILKRKIKTKEQRLAELEAQIKKKQAALEKIDILEEDASPVKRSSSKSAKRKKEPSPVSSSKKKALTVAELKRQNKPKSPVKEEKTMTVADRKRQASKAHDISDDDEPPVKRPAPQKTLTVAAKKRIEKINTPVKKQNLADIETLSSEEEVRPQKNSKPVAEKKRTQVEEAEDRVKRQTRNSMQVEKKTDPVETCSTSKEEPVKNGWVKLDEPETVEENLQKKLWFLLSYFAPPKWKYSKEELQKLTIDKLIEFPTQDFATAYRSSFETLMSNMKKKEENSRNLLEKYRKLAVKLMGEELTDPKEIDERFQSFVSNP